MLVFSQIPDEGYEEVMDTDACAGKNNAINFLEHVQAQITLKSKRRGDLIIHLTSPSGTKSTILPQRPNDSDRYNGGLKNSFFVSTAEDFWKSLLLSTSWLVEWIQAQIHKLIKYKTIALW